MKHVARNYLLMSVLSLCLAVAAGCTANQPSSPAGSVNAAVSPGSVADWESSALSIPELARAADIIVRARVVEAPASRTITQELPMVDEQGTPVATVTDSMLFSDTLFEVVNSYSGTLPAQIYVMQIGGTSPDGSVLNEFPDDPLYRVGDEYILFMVDISGDKVQAPDRELYRTVNPAGRFLIDGAKVRSFWADPAVAGTLPQTVDDLVTQIKQANP